MNFSNYKMLCEAMGAAKKAGMDNDEDFEQLEVAVEKLIGSFIHQSYALMPRCSMAGAWFRV